MAFFLFSIIKWKQSFNKETDTKGFFYYKSDTLIHFICPKITKNGL